MPITHKVLALTYPQKVRVPGAIIPKLYFLNKIMDEHKQAVSEH